MSEVLTRLCKVEELETETAKRIELENGEAVAVCLLNETVYVVDDLCSHGLASLAEGDIEGDEIFCPFHGGSFDIKTGKAVERPCTLDIKTYKPVIDNGEIFIHVE